MLFSSSTSSSSVIFSIVATLLIRGNAFMLWLGEIPLLGTLVPSGSSIERKILLLRLK